MKEKKEMSESNKIKGFENRPELGLQPVTTANRRR